MKTKMFIIVLLGSIAFVACSPLSTPIPEKTLVPTSTFSQVLPTSPPTPFSAPGSAHAKEYQEVQAFQDSMVGGNWGFQVYKGEKAFLDQDEKVLEIQDSQGRVKMENLHNDLYRFYAWEDGYDVIVGSGYLYLNAGNSYTFNWSAEHGNPEQVEVRLISNDQLLGYALLIMTYDSNGSFTGYETPVAFLDTNGDGLVSLQELEFTLTGLREGVSLIKESQPSLAAKFEGEINSASAAKNSGAISDAYQKVKQIQLELANSVQTANELTAKDQAMKDQQTTYISVAIAVVILLLAVFFFGNRKRKRIHASLVNKTSSATKKVVKKSKQLESQKGGTEPSRVKKEYKPKGQSIQGVVGITVCPNCKMKVVPKSDGTCPSCQSKIM